MIYLYLQNSSMFNVFFGSCPWPQICTSAHSFPSVSSTSFGLKPVDHSGLNHAVPLQIATSFLSSHRICFSASSILVRASSSGPTYWRGQDHELKCGMSHGVWGENSSSDRTKDQHFSRGVSLILMLKKISGRGVGEVIIARWREWRMAPIRWKNQHLLLTK